MSEIYSRVAKNSGIILCGRVIQSFISFFVFIYLANYFGEELFGRFSIALNYIAIFDILINFGLNQILIRELSFKKHNHEMFFWNGFIIKLILTFIAIALSSIIANVVNYPNQTIILIYILSLELILSSKLSSTRTIFEIPYNVELKMTVPIITSTFDLILFGLGIYYFTKTTQLGLIGLAVIYSLSHLPGCFILLWRFFKDYQIKFKSSLTTMKYLVIESYPLFIYLLFSILNTRIDILILSILKGDADVGMYSAATRLVYPLMFLSTSLSISIFPVLSMYFNNNQIDLFISTMKNAIKYIIIISVFIVVCIGLNSDKIIRMFYVKSYYPSALAFRNLIFSIGLSFINFFIVDIFTSIKRQNINSICLGIILIISTILNIIFIPKYGFIGASYIRLISTALLFIVFITILKFKFKTKLLDNSFKLILLILMFSILQICLTKVTLIIGLIISFILYILMILKLGLINKSEINKIKIILIK